MKKFLLGVMLLFGYGLTVAQTSDTPLFYNTFDDSASMARDWVSIDGDADGRSWYHERIGFFPTTCDGNDNSGFAAVLWNQNLKENNDWLITASPVALPAGKSHISFYYGLAQPFYEEYINVYCGKTADTAAEGLMKLGTVMVNNTGWYFAHFDFEPQDAGDYYFSFQYHTPESNEYGVMLDNVLIDKGIYVGTPDLAISNVILPPASCSMGAERIGVRVRNDGTADITEWTMTYSVNGGTPVRETFTRRLGEGGSDTVYFLQTADFSEPDTDYEVEVRAEVVSAVGGKQEEKIGNNTGKNTVVHMEPVNRLPY
ncbi:MAG: choice-of-anchor J domain-containing protein, partial [Bacteroides sp.]|nr:choice-of-anchor J domain-containing protein [Bacteroides sp.]